MIACLLKLITIMVNNEPRCIDLCNCDFIYEGLKIERDHCPLDYTFVVYTLNKYKCVTFCL